MWYVTWTVMSAFQRPFQDRHLPQLECNGIVLEDRPSSTNFQGSWTTQCQEHVEILEHKNPYTSLKPQWGRACLIDMWVSIS